MKRFALVLLVFFAYVSPSIVEATVPTDTVPPGYPTTISIHPNPVRGPLFVAFKLGRNEDLGDLLLIDVTGHVVSTIPVRGAMKAGEHSIGRDLCAGVPSGVYWIALTRAAPTGYRDGLALRGDADHGAILMSSRVVVVR